MDFGEWASNYKTWLVRQADYRRAYPGERMNNPLHTPEDYELFLYTLTEKFPSVRRSTVTFARRGATLARVAGELFFDMEFRIVVRERICYQRIPSSMDGLVQ
ncbi:MAG: hypothetical protein DRI57_07080 [Deltaproteobacteria bacterium]|nr:MAG: hypothetical protein DRI57_07080 [Deltaproteobacteria bacterium]